MAISIAVVRCVLDSVSKVIADLSGYLDLNRMAFLPCYWNTDLSWDLVRALDRLLVALPVLLGMALRSTADSIPGLSFSLSFTLLITISTISAMTMSNNLRVMTNNSRAVVNLSVGSVALGGEGFLALLDVGGVNNSLAHWAGDLAGVLDWLLVALPVLLVMTLRTSGISRLSFSIGITLAISVSSMSVGHNL